VLLSAPGSAPVVSECGWFAAGVVAGLVTGLAGGFVSGSALSLLAGPAAVVS
jgi:hypothetical protein